MPLLSAVLFKMSYSEVIMTLILNYVYQLID
jgi:ABC-type uncharacterized transport system permease subunit